MFNYKHHDLRGNLYFIFDVEFPDDNFASEEDLKVEQRSWKFETALSSSPFSLSLSLSKHCYLPSQQHRL